MRATFGIRAKSSSRNDPMAPHPTCKMCFPLSRGIPLLLRNPSEARVKSRGAGTEGAEFVVCVAVEIFCLVVPCPAAWTLHCGAAWHDLLATSPAQQLSVPSGECHNCSQRLGGVICRAHAEKKKLIAVVQNPYANHRKRDAVDAQIG